jgi:hypothetical protein
MAATPAGELPTDGEAVGAVRRRWLDPTATRRVVSTASQWAFGAVERHFRAISDPIPLTPDPICP